MEIKEIEDFRITETESFSADWVLAVKITTAYPTASSGLLRLKYMLSAYGMALQATREISWI